MASKVPFGAGYTPEQMERGKVVLRRFEAWERVNPDAMGFMEKLFQERVEAGEAASGAWLVEQARKRSFVDADGNDTKINNDYAPIIARRLMRKYPQHAHLFERRSTVFDWLV